MRTHKQVHSRASYADRDGERRGDRGGGRGGRDWDSSSGGCAGEWHLPEMGAGAGAGAGAEAETEDGEHAEGQAWFRHEVAEAAAESWRTLAVAGEAPQQVLEPALREHFLRDYVDELAGWTVLTMAILTMAILTMAILTMAILTTWTSSQAGRLARGRRAS